MPVNAIITPIERINKEHVSIITPIKKYSPTNVGLTAIPTNVNKYNLPYFHILFMLSNIYLASSFI